MKIRQQILAYGFVGALMASGVGAMGWFATQRQSATLDAVLEASGAVRLSMDGDMMHDAIRGDVMAAMLAAERRDSGAVDEARQSLIEHRQRFAESMKELKTQTLPDEVQRPLDTALPKIESYSDTASRLVAQAASDAAAAKALMPEFDQRFSELEEQMQALGDTLLQHAATLADQGRSEGRSTQLWIAIALAAALAALAVVALWVAGAIARPIVAAAQLADRLADGELCHRVNIRGQGETAQLLRSLLQMQERFAGIVRGVRSNAEEVALASSEIAQGNSDLSGRTEQQAAALQQTAASMQQLGTTVHHNADSAQQANRLALGASTVAVSGGSVVAKVVDTMKGIDSYSKKISDITGLIDSIAFQTNILALNAAVEAARAGEQGRGFAVVAGEVRSLAQRSAEAAKEIKGLIGASAEQVEQGSRLVDEAGTTMSEVVAAIQRVAQIVGEISSASTRQSADLSQVADALGAMDHGTQQNAALVEQSAAAAESLRSRAQQLVQSVAVFRLDSQGAKA